jgi:protocatechuate 3,4-dioxygenase beta subunit
MNHPFDRRQAIKIGSTVFLSGALSALDAFLTGCGMGTTATTSSSAAAGSSSSSNSTSSGCAEATNVTRGPYFIDNQSDSNISNDVVDTSTPERTDIRSDAKGSTGLQAGLPLTLNVTVGAWSGSTCSAIQGAQVHIWHCNAQGNYSDVGSLTSENFLRGYSYTDASGNISFTTIYPGWYSGRTVHIHLKIRIFDSSGKVTTEATTQLFFDDSISNAVYAANSSYKSAARDTANSADSIYGSEDPALLVSLNGNTSSGYTGTISIGINVGTIYGG